MIFVMDKPLKSAMKSLSERRPVFHSEDDFKFELAWELKTKVGFQVQIEFPFHLNKEKDTKGNPRNLRLDLRLSDGKKRYGIELKYKTKPLKFDDGDLKFSLKDQSATDYGSYDFMRDIWRIEQLTQESQIDSGYSILLTNSHEYWQAGKKDTNYDDFKLSEGRIISGSRRWSEKASSGTTKSRAQPINHKNVSLMNQSSLLQKK